MPKQNEKPKEPIEKQLWKAADKLRKNIDAAGKSRQSCQNNRR